LSLLFFTIPGGNKDIILMIVGALTVSIANMTKSFGETESREIGELKEARDSCMSENLILNKRIDDMQNQLSSLQTMIIEKLSNLQK
jgi:regulator of replication initiation timing